MDLNRENENEKVLSLFFIYWSEKRKYYLLISLKVGSIEVLFCMF